MPTQDLEAPQQLSFAYKHGANAQPHIGLCMPWEFCVLLHFNRGRCRGHLHKWLSAAKAVLTFSSCHMLVPGRFPFLHPLSQWIGAGKRSWKRWQRDRAGWEGDIGWGGRKEAKQRRGPEQSPSVTFRLLLDLQAEDEHRGESSCRQQAAKSYGFVDVLVGKVKKLLLFCTGWDHLETCDLIPKSNIS